MVKPKTTKTTGPLHFEDLEPHRFEALVRSLLWDFKDWQTIESTGEAGSDDGFDIRAWEKVEEIANDEEDVEDGLIEAGVHTMEGNLWKIQCKREKELGPSRIEKIIEETVNQKEEIYGYILAAPVKFSKESYDVFREKLREKGVREFYLWGRSELEDKLYLPKNDRILFTFFGISTGSQRRTRRTEIKFLINNKNKLFKLFNGQEGNGIREPILVRDFNDNKYPYEGEYPDFEKNPRWQDFIVFGYHPLGIWIHSSERLAYIDKEKKNFDFIKNVDLLYRESENIFARDVKKEENKDIAREYWQHIPQANQALLKIDGFISYEDILVIDEKGDIHFRFPHVFVDYKKNQGKPFRGIRYTIEKNGEVIDLHEEDYKKIDYFPKELPNIPLGTINKDKYVDWDEQTIRALQKSGGLENIGRIYDVDSSYSFLKPGDVIAVKKSFKDYEGDDQKDLYLEITYIFETTFEEFIKKHGDSYTDGIKRQVKRELKPEEKMSVLEVKQIYDWAIERRLKK